MDCYKFTINGAPGSSAGSTTTLQEILSKLFTKDYGQHMGFRFKENDTFPKVYYFKTTQQGLLDRIKSAYQVEESDYPPIDLNGEYKNYGNGHFFPQI